MLVPTLKSLVETVPARTVRTPRDAGVALGVGKRVGRVGQAGSIFTVRVLRDVTMMTSAVAEGRGRGTRGGRGGSPADDRGAEDGDVGDGGGERGHRAWFRSVRRSTALVKVGAIGRRRRSLSIQKCRSFEAHRNEPRLAQFRSILSAGSVWHEV